MADDVRALSAELAQDPHSLVFLRLGELLRHRGQLDAAHRVAVAGLERHPHHADAHDLFARILTDKRDYERAFDEWDMALRIAPNHVGALKGLAFLYFKVGDVAQAEAHLAEAARLVPEDPSIAQAIAFVRGATGPAAAPPPEPAATAASDTPPADAGAVTEAATAASAAAEPAATPMPRHTPGGLALGVEEARVFAGLEGAQEGLLLLDHTGLVLGGALRDRQGRDVTDAVAAYLAGVSQEAARTAKLLGLGEWKGCAAEATVGHAHLCQPRGDAMLLVVRDRSVPLGRLAIMAQRASHAARRWLERQGAAP
jgi:tetratricopeptide (TPR) repeat protein